MVMSNKYDRITGVNLLVIRGPWRGHVGELTEVKKLDHGLCDLVLKFDDSDEETSNITYATIPEEDCKDYNTGNFGIENPYDIFSYLSYMEICDIMKKAVEGKVNLYMNDILYKKNKYTDKYEKNYDVFREIFRTAINEYAKELLDPYKEELLSVFKKIITLEVPVDSGDENKTFAEQIEWSLVSAATDYIKNNPEEIQNVMKNRIHEHAQAFLDKELSWSLSSALKNAADEVVEKTMNVK